MLPLELIAQPPPDQLTDEAVAEAVVQDHHQQGSAERLGIRCALRLRR